MLEKFLLDLKEKDKNLPVSDFLTPELERYFIIQFLNAMSNQHSKSDRPEIFNNAMSFSYKNIANKLHGLKYAADCESERQQTIVLTENFRDREWNPLIKFGYNQVIKRLLQKLHYDICMLNGTILCFLNFINKNLEN